LWQECISVSVTFWHCCLVGWREDCRCIERDSFTLNANLRLSEKVRSIVL